MADYNPNNLPGLLDEQAFEHAQAYILTAYDTGITLLKANASGEYSEVHLVKTIDANGHSVFSPYHCY
jgi:hypothetical protein